jgi:hypothetical protein
VRNPVGKAKDALSIWVFMGILKDERFYALLGMAEAPFTNNETSSHVVELAAAYYHVTVTVVVFQHRCP